MMEKYSIGYSELMDFPFDKYLEFSQILTEEAKEKKKKQARQEDKIDGAT